MLPLNKETSNTDILLVELSNKIQVLLDKHEEMAENIAKIKEAIYNPDQGLYARIRELETWKENYSRIIWLVLTSIIGLGAHTLWNILSSTN
tara:strand:+ start:97 stop:372 length:276 start_codon:yes stop_codon:yes gene_type:complete